MDFKIKEAIKEKAYEFINTLQYVSFAWLWGHIEHFDGEFELFDTPKVILWHRLSEEAVIALDELRNSKKIFFHPCEFIVYVIDGFVPDLPRKKSKKYSPIPQWLPVTICTSPYEP